MDVKVEYFADCDDEDENPNCANQRENLVQHNIDPDGQSSSVDEGGGEKDKVKCPICSISFKNLRYMKVHLSWKHFGDATMKASGSSSTKCSLCNFELASRFASAQTMVSHLTSKHGYLHKVVPDDLAQKLSQMGEDEKGSDNPHTSGEAGPEGIIKCPYCKGPSRTHKSLVRHMVIHHHLDDILSKSGCVDTDCCSICGRNFTSTSYSKKQKLASHLALAHGYLDVVITGQERHELESIKKYLEKNKYCLKTGKIKTKFRVPKNPLRVKKKLIYSERNKYKREGPLIVPDNMKKCIAAFRDAQDEGKFGDNPCLANCSNKDGKAKSFLVRPGTTDWKCYLCSLKSKMSYHLKAHLATKHFRQEVLFFWPEMESNEHCPYCDEHVLTDPSLKVRVKEFLVINHLANKHDLLYHVVGDNICQSLDEMRSIAVTCPLCQAVQKSMAALEDHLILTHYRAELREASKSSGSRCGICNQSLRDGKTMLRHIARKHGLIKKVFPQEVLDYIGPLEKAPETIFIKEDEKSNNAEAGDHDFQMNFVDVSSVEPPEQQVKAEPEPDTLADASLVKVTPAMAANLLFEPDALSLEVGLKKKAKKSKLDVKLESKVTQEDLSDIVVTDPHLGTLST